MSTFQVQRFGCLFRLRVAWHVLRGKRFAASMFVVGGPGVCFVTGVVPEEDLATERGRAGWIDFWDRFVCNQPTFTSSRDRSSPAARSAPSVQDKSAAIRRSAR